MKGDGEQLLALSVLRAAWSDRLSVNREERESALYFLFHDTDVFPFWCKVAQVDPQFLREHCIRNYSTTKRSTIPITLLS